jgi:hypothetical protein
MPDFGIFRGFNDNLFGDKLFAGQLPINLGNNFDPDVVEFFGRVTAAGGTLSATEQVAIDTLVKQMKLDGIWTKMKAIYPMVGASAAACAQNLKSSSFTGTFTAGWTFASTGVTPNGTSAYFNTTLIPNTNLSLNNSSFSVYSRNNFTPTTNQSLGCSDGGISIPLIGFTFFPTKSVNGLSYSYNSPDVLTSAIGQNFSGMFLTTRTSASSAKLLRNTTSLASVTTQGQTTQPVNTFTFGAFKNGAVFIDYNNFQFAFAHIGDGLTDTQASNFYTAVQSFQTTLSRQV